MDQTATLGAYRVLRTIGRGGMGTVLLAVDPRLGRPVAIKLLDHVDADLAARLRDEAQLMAELQHPHLMPVLDVGEDVNGMYLVMPYMAGGPLDRLVETGGPLDPGRAVTVLASTAQALAAMHGRGVVHRDVKPSNVLLSEGGDAYLADFGLAWASQSARRTATGMFAGTLGFAAPELLDGAEPSPATDAYALGVLGYYLLAGRPPYAGESMAAVVRQVSLGEHPPLSTVAPAAPPALASAIEAAMATDPGARPVSLSGWADAITRIVAPMPLGPVAMPSWPATPLSSGTPDAAVSLRVCSRCKAQVPTTDAHCGYCGNDLAGQPRSRPPATPTVDATAVRPTRGAGGQGQAASAASPRRQRRILLMVGSSLAAVAVVAAVVVVLVLPGPRPSPPEAAAPAAAQPKQIQMLGYSVDHDLGFTPTAFACGVTVSNLVPTGKFCRLDVKVRNVADSGARTFLPRVQHLEPAGSAPVPLHETATRLADTAQAGRDVPLSPGQEAAAVLVWDAPAGADTETMRVRLHAEAASPGVSVSAHTTPAEPAGGAPPPPAPLEARVARTCGASGRGDCFLSVRAAPTKESAEVGRYDEGAMVAVVCQVQGATVHSSLLGVPTTVWVRDLAGAYMTAAFLDVAGWDPTTITVPC